MRLSEIFAGAARLVWRHKALWFLGLLVALGAEYGGPGMPFVPSFGNADLSDLSLGDVGAIPAWVWPTVMGFAAVGIGVSLILLFIGLIARGGLIAGVQQIEHGDAVSIGAAWKAGAKRVWRMLGMVLTLYLPVIAVVVIGLAAGTATFMGAAAWQDTTPLQMREMMAAAVPAIASLSCLAAVYSLVASGFEVLAERAIIIDELTVKDSLRKAWNLFTAHLGQIVVVALGLFVIDLGIGLVTAFGIMAVMLPFVVSAVAAFENQVTATGIGLIAAGMLAAVVIGLLVGAVFTSYVSTVWTLVYRQLLVAVKPAAQTPAAPPAPLPT